MSDGMVDPLEKAFLDVTLAEDKEFTYLSCIKRYVLALLLYYYFLWSDPRRYVVIYLWTDPWAKGLSFRRRLMFCILGHPIRMAWNSIRKPYKFSAEHGPITRVLHSLCMYQQILMTTIFGRPRGQSCSKNYWRNAVLEQGGSVPPLLGTYSCATQAFEWLGEVGSKDLFIKTETGGFGFGDLFLQFGKDFSTKQEIEEKLREHMKTLAPSLANKGTMLILERILPDEKFGVHNVMIVTGKAKDGHVCVLHAMMEAGGTGASSHSCKERYLLDPIVGMIVGGDQWTYKPVSPETRPEWIGRSLPGLRAACDTAVKVHSALLAQDKECLRFVGWDFMFTEDGGVVFFEGNPVRLRLQNFMCTSFAALRQFINLSPSPA